MSTTKIKLALLALSLLFSADALMAGENMIKTPSFHFNDTTNWKSLSRSTTEYHTAPASLSLVATTYWKNCYQDVAVYPEKFYSAAAWCKFVGTGSGVVELRWYNAAGDQVGYTGIVYPKTDVDWTYYERKKFAPPASAVKGRYYVAMAQNYTATIFVDDVVFEDWIDPATLVVIR